MVYMERSCSGALAEFVDCEWSVRSNGDAMVVYPDGFADLLLDESGRLFLVGVDDKAKHWRISPHAMLRGFRMKPGSLLHLFGIPASEIVNQSVPIEDVPSSLTEHLSSLASHSDNQDEMVEAIRKLLSRKCAQAPRPNWLQYALSQIGRSSVRSVANSLNMTERHLYRLFVTEVGMGPARFKRIIRLQRTLDAMRLAPANVSMAEMAYECGFSDQAHMYHEIREMTGKTPTELLRDIQTSF